jgi:predicted phosphodiesterase
VVVSDVHGNLTALEAVADELERRGIGDVVHGGDLALIGARPAAVVDRIRELGWPGMLGNTDELLFDPDHDEQVAEMPALAPLLHLLFTVYAPTTRERLGPERVQWLSTLPRESRRGHAAIIHASPTSLWRAPLPDSDDRSLAAAYASLGSTLVVYGHIHRPFVRHVGPMTIANAGSVGLPWDGDTRASFLLIEDETVSVVRVAYDVERETAALRRERYPDAERIADMLRTGTFRPMRGSN